MNVQTSSLKPFSDELLQLDGVDSKFANTLGKLLNSHLILIVLPTERLLVHGNLLEVLS